MPKDQSDDYSYEEKQSMPYAKITLKSEDRRDYHANNIWEFNIEEFVQNIDPKSYFATTGEAIIKMKKLEKDLFVAAGMARKMGNTLKKLKGENIYLETCWTDNKLLLKAKNPRKNKEEKLKALYDNFEG